jgi:hypothetical protein
VSTTLKGYGADPDGAVVTHGFGAGLAAEENPSDMLADGLAFLTEQLTDHAAKLVTYSRGSDSVEVRATWGAKLLKLSGEFDVRIEWTDMDFCIKASLLVLNGEQVIPRRGDMIQLVINEEAQTFEVFPFGDEPPWRWADPHQSMVRVHTKRINSESIGA